MSHTLSFMSIMSSIVDTLRPAPGVAQIPHRRKCIYDLQQDILYEIFLVLVEEEFEEGYNTKFSRYPWVLSEVCKSWRRICMEHSRLWAYLSLIRGHDCPPKSYQVFYHETSPKALLRTCLQLERSRSSLLHIDVYFRCHCREQASSVRVALAHAHRWGYVSLDVTVREGVDSEPGSFSRFKNLIPVNAKFSAMRELKWLCDQPGFSLVDGVVRGGRLMLPFPNSGDMTSLRSVTFNSLQYHHTDGAFPWGRLQALTLHNYLGNILDLFTLLLKCDNLAHLELRVFQHLSLNPADLTRLADDPDSALYSFSAEKGILFPNLVSLAFSHWSIDGTSVGFNLLEYIRAPNLRHLDYRTETNLAEFKQIINKCECSRSLKRLSMYYPRLPNDADGMRFTKGYGNLEGLEHISLQPSPRHITWTEADEANGGCDPLLKEMTLPEEDRDEAATEHKLLPRLKHLELHNLQFDPVLLSQMVESRMNRSPHCVPLRSITTKGAPCGSIYFKDVLNTLLGKYVHGVGILTLDVILDTMDEWSC